MSETSVAPTTVAPALMSADECPGNFFVGEKNLVNNFIAIIITLIVFMPVIMRLSRNIWINLFMSYDKDWKQHKGEKKATLR